MSKTTDTVVAQILEALDQGIVPWRKPWKTSAATNPDGRAYTGINQLVLSMTAAIKEYEGSQWYTYNRAKNDNNPVRKGEKGTKILFWKPIEHDVVDDQGNISGTETRGFYRHYSVFNESQLTHPVEVDPKAPITEIPAADVVVEMYKDKPEIRHGGNRAAYSPKEDLVLMPVRSDFDTSDDYYHTLFHELAHSTGHKSRLNRSTLTETAAFGSEVYAEEELVAEMASAFLCQNSRVRVDIENTASYISSWRKYIADNSSSVVRAASKANKAYEYILK